MSRDLPFPEESLSQALHMKQVRVRRKREKDVILPRVLHDREIFLEICIHMRNRQSINFMIVTLWRYNTRYTIIANEKRLEKLQKTIL